MIFIFVHFKSKSDDRSKKGVNSRRKKIKENKISNARITSIINGMEEELIERYKYLKNKLKENNDDSKNRSRIIEMNHIKLIIYSNLYKGMNNKLSKIKDASEQTNMFVHMINIVNNHYDIIFDDALHYNNNMFLDKYHGNLDSIITSMSKEKEKDLFRKYKLLNEEKDWSFINNLTNLKLDQLFNEFSN